MSPYDYTNYYSHLSLGNPNTEIKVSDILNVTFPSMNSMIDIDHSPTQYMMAGVWQVSRRKGLGIIW